MTLTASFLAVVLAIDAHAQSLALHNVNYPGIYCHFSPGCSESPVDQTGTFTPTNAAVTCVLTSHSFPGANMDSAGTYGYEYQLTLNNNGSTDGSILSVNSLTLNFGQPVPFAFGQHASNYVWVVTMGGPNGLPPSEADQDGSKVVVHFDPPLSLNTSTDQSTNTYFFGLISTNAPTVATALLSGSVQASTNSAPANFKATLQAQVP